MSEHDPGLIEQQIGRLAPERSLEAAKQVKQDGDQTALAHPHEVADLESRKPGFCDAVLLRIEQPTEGAFQRVEPESLADRLVLYL